MDNIRHLHLAGNDRIRSRSVVVATGAKYRRLAVDNDGRYETTQVSAIGRPQSRDRFDYPPFKGEFQYLLRNYAIIVTGHALVGRIGFASGLATLLVSRQFVILGAILRIGERGLAITGVRSHRGLVLLATKRGSFD